VFDTATVERFIAFSRLCPHVKGPLRGQPIELEPWQQFAFANLLGFKVRVRPPEVQQRLYRGAA
jgi:phage terminase large subunit-like protein